MASIADLEREIVDEFAVFDQWMDRYEYLIDLGRGLPELDARHKREENLVPGCQSRVWLHAALADGRVTFAADSDAIITKGIIALLIRVLSGQPPAAICDAELAFLDTIGLRAHLSPARSNGLVNMVAKLKSSARSLAAA